jgi:hypothetical protein
MPIHTPKYGESDNSYLSKIVSNTASLASAAGGEDAMLATVYDPAGGARQVAFADDVSSIAGRVEVLEGNIHEYEIFQSIESGTGGTVTKPTHATIILGEYEGGLNCALVEVDSATGRPKDCNVTDSAGYTITATLTAGGVYSLSGTPSGYPIALVFQIQLSEKYRSELATSRIINESQSEDVPYAGAIVSPQYVDNGDGTITVATVECGLYDNSVFHGCAHRYKVASATVSLTNNTTNYVIVSYNGGSPAISAITDRTLLNGSDVIFLWTIYRNGNFLHPLVWDAPGAGLAEKLHNRFVGTRRIERAEGSGLVIGEVATRTVTITSGNVWNGVTQTLLGACSSATDTTFLYYHAGGVWTYSLVTQYNNTQYDNGTNLATLTANRYGVSWVYRGVENAKHVYIVLGTGDYLLSQAQASQPPAVPQAISSHALLVGRIIVQKNATTATEIDSAFVTTFTSAGITNHNDLSNIESAANGVTYGHVTDGNQTIAGVKTFSSFPVTPSSAPISDYQAANKKYVDDAVAGSSGSLALSCSLDFADEQTYATVEVTNAAITATSNIVASIAGTNAEEAIILGVSIGVISQSDGSCVIAGACENGASGIINVNLHII